MILIEIVGLEMKDKILVIDDSVAHCEVFKCTLEKHFDVYVANNGEQGITLVRQHDFLVVILDIEMPGMNGFQVCQHLKNDDDSNLNDAAIVFISAHDDEETTLKCFEYGSDDFISKSQNISVAAKKIRAIARYRRIINKKTNNDGIDLSGLVDATMMQASFYGSCVNLLADLHLVNSEKEMADLIFSYMAQQGLNTSIHFENGDYVGEYDQEHAVFSPIQKKVFSLLRGKGRLYEFSGRMMVNDEHVSVLIKQMPEHGTDQYGLLIDVLAKLVPAIEMKYRALINYQQIDTAQNQLRLTIDDIQQATHSLQLERQHIIDEMTSQIGLSFHEYEFTEQQEAFLVKLIEQCVVKQSDSNERFLDINKKLNTITQTMQESEVLPYQQEEANQDVELF